MAVQWYEIERHEGMHAEALLERVPHQLMRWRVFWPVKSRGPEWKLALRELPHKAERHTAIQASSTVADATVKRYYPE
jgi:hypothetical protein